jgi:hypothetical protein
MNRSLFHALVCFSSRSFFRLVGPSPAVAVDVRLAEILLCLLCNTLCGMEDQTSQHHLVIRPTAVDLDTGVIVTPPIYVADQGDKPGRQGNPRAKSSRVRRTNRSVLPTRRRFCSRAIFPAAIATQTLDAPIGMSIPA